ncbi:MAG: HAD-IA family hydrolase [Candidatus Nomurabacteria bacterium]|jgi:epoxide hydrolase-like predicted phosphatase|nr:HAD-IA family hydrolase [Candidatus Nomurabacteria bacterium]
MSEILKIVEKIKSGKTTVRTEVEAAIARAEADGAILKIIREQALKRANEIDAKIVKGESAGRLAGVPFAVEDSLLILDGKTTVMGKILEDFISPSQATAIDRLEAEGAILIGQTNARAFSCGGDSPSGAAEAVARSIVPFALGHDTGGSILQSASQNGVLGYKPTYGMTSRYGVVAVASSMDTVSLLTNSVEDIELLCGIMAGPDGRDSMVFPNYFSATKIKALIFDCFGVLTNGELDILSELYPKHHDAIWKTAKPFDRGDWSLEQFAGAIADIVGSNQEDILSGIREVRSVARRNKRLLEMIARWKSEYKIGLLSNIGEKTFELVFTPDEQKMYFDDIVLSYREKMVKPDPAIYRLAAERLSVNPDECIFIDDKQKYVDVAEEVGMTGTLFDDTEKVIKRIDEILKPAQAKKIGLIKEFIGENVDETVRERVLKFVEKLRTAGHTVDEISLPMTKYALPIYRTVMTAEVSSNMMQYDGIRYGRLADGAKTLTEIYSRSRGEGFDDETKRRVMTGYYVLSSEFFDKYYLQAQKARTMLISEFNKLFEKYDFLIGPDSPTTTFKTDEPSQMYLADAMTAPVSLAGLPTISVPTDGDLPIGVQIIGPMKSDSELLNFAGEVEK